MTAYVTGTGAVSQVLKRTYASRPHDTLNSKHTFFKRVRKEYNKDGLEIQSLYRTGGTGSMGYQGERDILQSPGQQSWANGTILPFEFWSNLALSVRFLSQSKTRTGAWYKRFASEMKHYVRDVMVRHELYAFGDGDGLIGQYTSTAPTTTFVLANWQDARKVRIGTRIAFWNDVTYSGDTLYQDSGGATYATVTNVTLSGTTATVTLDQDVSAWSSPPAGSDYAFFHRARTASGSQTPPGLKMLIGVGAEKGTTNLQGLPVASNFWQSGVLTNGTNRPLTDTLLQQAIDVANIRGDEDIDFFTCSLGARLDWAVDELNKRRNVNTMRLAGETAGGFKERRETANSGLQYGEVTFFPSRFHEPNVVNGIRLADLCKYYWERLQWWEETPGAVFHKAYDSSTQMVAEQFCIDNFCVENRNHHVRIEAVEESEAPAI